MSDTAEKYKIAFDAYQQAQWDINRLGKASSESIDMADRFARSLGYAPAPPPPERRVVRVRDSCSYRVNPDDEIAACSLPFQFRDHGGWRRDYLISRKDATPGTILGELLRAPNVGDVPEPLPPLPAITDGSRTIFEAWAGEQANFATDRRAIYAYIVAHAPRKDT